MQTVPCMKCPKCGSSNCTKSGYKATRAGPVQAATCKGCGYRGTVDKFRPALPMHDEVRSALGGVEPPFLPGCSIPGIPGRGTERALATKMIVPDHPGPDPVFAGGKRVIIIEEPIELDPEELEDAI